MTEALTASLEDYLEAIFHIIAEKQAVRPKDIAKRLKVSNSSVTGALHSLANKKLINYAPYDVITLTPDGKTAAEDVIHRHEVFLKFLTEVLKVDFHSANKEACKMEHTLSPETIARLTDFMEFIQTCPRAGESWLSSFEEYRKHGRRPVNCLERKEKFSDEIKPKPMSVRKKSSVRKKA